MSIEKKLAQIQVLAKALSKNAKTDTLSPGFELFLSGIVEESEWAYRSYSKALQSVHSEKGSMYVADFGLSIKNMAENLNRFMQNVYAGETKPVLSKLSKSLENARKDVGHSLEDIFSVHDFSDSSSVKIARDSRGHGKGHKILEIEGKNSTVVLEDTKADAKAWLEENANIYFDMVNNAFRLMYENDSEHFEKKDLGSIFYQRTKNYVNRHKKTALITASVALLSIGIAAGYYGREITEISELNQVHHQRYSDAIYVVGSGVLTKEEMDKEYGVDSIRQKVLFDYAFDVAKGWGHDTLGIHRFINTSNPIFRQAYEKWETTDGKTYKDEHK